MADIFAEVASVGIQGLSSGGTVYVVPGATGSTGPQGDQGASGITGAAGASGVGGGGSGATGPQGASGVAGASGVGGGGSITVSNISGATGGATGSITNSVTGVTALRFDKDTGFNVSDLGSGEVKVSLGSAYKTIKVDGQSDLVATGEDTLRIVGGTGINITTNATSNPKALTISATGISGATGAAGATGPGGGNPGATGATGSQGLTGASGYVGHDGASGIQGASGLQGINGATGSQGATGIGASGATGYTGTTGATGIQGASGLGFTIIGAWDGGATYYQNDVVFYGAGVYVWIGPASGNSPTSPDLDGFNVRWLKTSGPDGASGATGPQGVQGASGISGASGYVGHDGASGYVGRDGATGTRGSTGAQGLTGATGISGQDGATGVGIIVTTTFTTSTTDQTIIDVVDTTLARSIKYEMQETSGSNYNASELRLLNSNENVFLTQYAGIGAPLGVFDTYFSPLNNNYSSPDITAGMSYWNGTTLRISTSNNIVIQALLSAVGSTEMTLNSGAYTITLATAFTEVSPGVYQATTVETHSPLQLISNIAWTGTGFCELRYTPNSAVTTLKYQKTEIEV